MPGGSATVPHATERRARAHGWLDWLYPPRTEDRGLAERARILYWFAVILVVGTTLYWAALVLIAPAAAARWTLIEVVIGAGAVFLVVAGHYGHGRGATWSFIGIMWVFMTWTMWTAGGVEAPSAMAQLALVVLCSVLLGWKEGVGGAVVATVVILSTALAQVAGVLPASQVVQTPWTRATTFTEYILIIGAATAMAGWTITRSRRELDRELVERRRAQAELLATRTGLESAVHARTADLERANGALEAKNVELEWANERLDEATRAKSQFLASMSHELRTPLNSVIGFSEILLTGAPGPLTEEQQRQLEMVARSGHHLLGLINQALDLSKIEEGGVPLQLEDVDVDDCVAEAVQSIAPLADAKGLKVTWERGPGVGTVWTDRTRLLQVLINILGNAVKFTDAGGVTVTARSEDHGALIAITDTGRGIAHDDLDRVFDDFYQCPGDPDGKAPGTGLGLSISNRIICSLGGQIDVTSEVGRGSTFCVWVPGVIPEEDLLIV